MPDNKTKRLDQIRNEIIRKEIETSGVPRGGLGGSTFQTPEIPKALQNRAKHNPIVKTVKNC